MSSVPNAITTSLVQTAQAQQVASKDRDRKRADADDAVLREDRIELRVDGVEDTEAARRVPDSASEESRDDARERPNDPSRGASAKDGRGGSLDVQA